MDYTSLPQVYEQYLSPEQPIQEEQPEEEDDQDVVVEDEVYLSPPGGHRRVEVTDGMLPIPGGFKLLPAADEGQEQGKQTAFLLMLWNACQP